MCLSGLSILFSGFLVCPVKFQTFLTCCKFLHGFCFILTVPLLLCMMFGLSSPVLSARFYSAVFPRCLHLVLIPYWWILSASVWSSFMMCKSLAARLFLFSSLTVFGFCLICLFVSNKINLWFWVMSVYWVLHLGPRSFCHTPVQMTQSAKPVLQQENIPKQSRKSTTE